MVPRNKKTIFVFIVNDKSKHAIEKIDKIISVFRIHMKYDFCVRRSFKRMAFLFQILSEFYVIINFAIIHDGKTIIRHGLMAAGDINKRYGKMMKNLAK